MAGLGSGFQGLCEPDGGVRRFAWLQPSADLGAGNLCASLESFMPVRKLFSQIPSFDEPEDLLVREQRRKRNRQHDSSMPSWMVRADARYDRNLPRAVRDALVWGNAVPLMPNLESIYSTGPGAVLGPSGAGKSPLGPILAQDGPTLASGGSGLSVQIGASGEEFPAHGQTSSPSDFQS